MPDEKKSKVPLALAGVIFVGLAGAVSVSGGLGWAGFQVEHVSRLISSGQKPEEPIYATIAKAPVSLANFVQECRVAWPAANVRPVHAAAAELATGLLHHADIEVGSLEQGKFVPWPMSHWAAAKKISTELKAMDDFLQDENRYAFRRK